MKAEIILILGILLGAGIIFAQFTYFRNFFSYPVNGIGLGGQMDNRSALSSNLLFFVLFILAIVGLVSFISHQPFQSEGDDRQEKFKGTDSPDYPINEPSTSSNLKMVNQQKNEYASIETKTYYNVSPEFSRSEDKNASPTTNELLDQQQGYLIQLAAGTMEKFLFPYAEEKTKEYPHLSVYFYWDEDLRLYKVLVGDFGTRKAAEQQQNLIEKQEQDDKFLVKRGDLDHNQLYIVRPP